MAHVNTARRGLGAAAALVLTLLASCGADSDSKASSGTLAAPVQANPASGTKSLSGGGEASADTTGAEATPATTPSAGVPTQQLNTGGRKLVITMTVGVEVADAAGAVDKVIALADIHGGQLYNSNLDLTDPDTASGDLVFKLPPDQVEAFLTGLDPGIGRRTGLQGNTADVTKQLTDLDAQILTAEASVDRVRGLLASAKDLNEVITLENEVSTRETHLEELRAQKADLDSQVAQATITVHLSTAPKVVEVPAPAPEPKKDKGIGAAFKDGWKGFVAMVRAIAIFIGYTAPFLVLMGLAGLIWWRISRRRPPRPSQSRSTAPPPPPAPGEGPRTSTPDSADAAKIP